MEYIWNKIFHKNLKPVYQVSLGILLGNALRINLRIDIVYIAICCEFYSFLYIFFLHFTEFIPRYLVYAYLGFFFFYYI